MNKKVLVIFCMGLLASSLLGCSSDSVVNEGTVESDSTLSEKVAEEKGILSKDDSEVLVYNQLSEEEKQNLTIDYVKEAGTEYFIRVYDDRNGTIEVKKRYTVDFNTEEVQQIE